MVRPLAAVEYPGGSRQDWCSACRCLKPSFEATDDQRQKLVRAAAEVYSRYRVPEVQIDFDATWSQRGFYRQVLKQIRAELPSQVRLSITALASWCLDDPWIADLPLDDAVPMLFDMGVDSHEVRRRLERGGDFQLEVCRKSVGLSVSEPVWRVPVEARICVLTPGMVTRVTRTSRKS